MAKRGDLTPTVQAAAKRLLQRIIIVSELRLMPRVQNLILNGEGIDIQKFNAEERAILNHWWSLGYIDGIGYGKRLTCGRYFWEVMSELLWLAYADHENQPE